MQAQRADGGAEAKKRGSPEAEAPAGKRAAGGDDALALAPGKKAKEFRNYKSSSRQETVERHYRLMRSNQSLAFSRSMAAKYGKFDREQMTVLECFERLKSYVDSSDPDSSLPNLEHMLQTAEAIRKAGHPDWFQLVGLLHDMGKVMFLWGRAEDGQQGTADGDQWALGGDTWVVGCRIPDSTVFPEFTALNPDMADARYNTDNGIYQPGCGVMNLTYAYGHDEYMFQMLKANGATIPDEGMAMIRLHSCYPWHTGGAYKQFETDKCRELKKWVLKFNQFDLYTKSDERPVPAKLWNYYQGLIDKYCPGKLWW